MQKKVLIVEHEVALAEALARRLLARGYETLRERTAAGALQSFDQRRPDLVVISLTLPDDGGRAACRGVRTRPLGALVPILFMGTGQEDVRSVSEAITAGADHYFRKPEEIDELVAKVTAYIGPGDERFAAKAPDDEPELDDAALAAALAGAGPPPAPHPEVPDRQLYAAIRGAFGEPPDPSAEGDRPGADWAALGALLDEESRGPPQSRAPPSPRPDALVAAARRTLLGGKTAPVPPLPGLLPALARPGERGGDPAWVEARRLPEPPTGVPRPEAPRAATGAAPAPIPTPPEASALSPAPSARGESESPALSPAPSARGALESPAPSPVPSARDAPEPSAPAPRPTSEGPLGAESSAPAARGPNPGSADVASPGAPGPRGLQADASAGVARAAPGPRGPQPDPSGVAPPGGPGPRGPRSDPSVAVPPGALGPRPPPIPASTAAPGSLAPGPARWPRTEVLDADRTPLEAEPASVPRGARPTAADAAPADSGRWQAVPLVSPLGDRGRRVPPPLPAAPGRAAEAYEIPAALRETEDETPPPGDRGAWERLDEQSLAPPAPPPLGEHPGAGGWRPPVAPPPPTGDDPELVLEPGRALPLEQRGIGEVLAAAAAFALRGRVEVASAGVLRRLFIENGYPVYADSSEPAEDLAAYLAGEGLIARTMLAEARSRAELSGASPEEVLIEAGYLQAEDVYRALRTYVIERTVGLFGLEAGESLVVRGGPRPLDPVDLGMHPGRLVLDGIRRKYGRLRLYRAYGTVSLVPAPRPGRAPPTGLALRPDEEAVRRATDGRRTVYEISRLTDVGEVDALAVLYGLTVMGLVEPPAGRRRAGALPPLGPESVARAGAPRTADQMPGFPELVTERHLVCRTADYFQVLNVPRSATGAEVRAAWERLRRQFDPHRVRRDGPLWHPVQEIADVLDDAFAMLSDPRRRSLYERNLE